MVTVVGSLGALAVATALGPAADLDLDDAHISEKTGILGANEKPHLHARFPKASFPDTLLWLSQAGQGVSIQDPSSPRSLFPSDVTSSQYPHQLRVQ